MFHKTIKAFICGLAFLATPVHFDVAHCQELMLAALNLEQAARMVQGNTSGRVLGAETRNIAGRTTHVIKVLTADGKRVRTIQVDAETGQISGGR